MEALHYTQRNDTICALATGGGSAAIAVIRISGPDTFRVLEDIFCPATKNKKIWLLNLQREKRIIFPTEERGDFTLIIMGKVWQGWIFFFRRFQRVV